MTEISGWSRSATNNKQTSPNGAQEGWVGSDLGPWARETMAAVSKFYQHALFISKLDDISPQNTPKTVAYTSASVITITGFTSNPEDYFPAGRLMQVVTSASITPGFVASTSWDSLGGSISVTLDCLANSVSGVAELPSGETYSSAGVQFCVLSEDGTNNDGLSYSARTGLHQTVGPIILSGGGTTAQRDQKFPVVPPADGVLWYNTTETSLQATSGGAWVSSSSDGGHNVKAYGATGDGTTDDQPDIQAAIDAAAIDGRPVLFPASANPYFLEDTLTVPDSVSLIGLPEYGDLPTLKWKSTVQKGVYLREVKNCSVQNLKIDTTAVTGVNSVAMLVNGAQNSRFQNLNFRGPKTAPSDPSSGVVSYGLVLRSAYAAATPPNVWTALDALEAIQTAGGANFGVYYNTVTDIVMGETIGGTVHGYSYGLVLASAEDAPVSPATQGTSRTNQNMFSSSSIQSSWHNIWIQGCGGGNTFVNVSAELAYGDSVVVQDHHTSSPSPAFIGGEIGATEGSGAEYKGPGLLLNVSSLTNKKPVANADGELGSHIMTVPASLDIYGRGFAKYSSLLESSLELGGTVTGTTAELPASTGYEDIYTRSDLGSSAIYRVSMMTSGGGYGEVAHLSAPSTSATLVLSVLSNFNASVSFSVVGSGATSTLRINNSATTPKFQNWSITRIV